MKILFCSPFPLDRKLGAVRTVMDMAEELEKLGWQCTLVGPAEVGATQADYPDKLLAYLKQHADAYDVVEFDYKRLALERSIIGKDTLFVARGQLVIHLHLNIHPPPLPIARARLRSLLLGPRDHWQLKMRLRRVNATLQAADLVVLSNAQARKALIQHGIVASKIHVVANGLTEAQIQAFDTVPVAPPGGATVAFIGMYGPRKGAGDFPALVRRVTEAVPEARFRLLGTRGRFKTEEEVLALFPRNLRSRVEIIPRYDPESLPALLAPCSVGVFPSYVEGFPWGVLEMLAAALPVVAYDAPGPPEMLPPAYLVSPGDTEAMSQKIIRLLQEREVLAEARRDARKRAHQFRLPRIAQSMADMYEDALAKKQAGLPVGIE